MTSKNAPDKALTEDSFSLHCAGTLYSFMLSPIIPLPPIIPSYGAAGNGDAWLTFNKDLAVKFKLSSVKLLDSNSDSMFEQMLDYNSDDIRHLSLPFKCKDLHDATLMLGYSDILNNKKFNLIYKKSDVEWNWGYLH